MTKSGCGVDGWLCDHQVSFSEVSLLPLSIRQVVEITTTTATIRLCFNVIIIPWLRIHNQVILRRWKLWLHHPSIICPEFVKFPYRGLQTQCIKQRCLLFANDCAQPAAALSESSQLERDIIENVNQALDGGVTRRGVDVDLTGSIRRNLVVSCCDLRKG